MTECEAILMCPDYIKNRMDDETALAFEVMLLDSHALREELIETSLLARDMARFAADCCLDVFRSRHNNVVSLVH